MLSCLKCYKGRDPRRWFFLVTLIIVLLDQGSKFILSRFIPLGASIKLIPGFLNLVHIYNPGVAFGLFATHSSWLRYLFSGINLLAAIILFFVAKNSSGVFACCLGLIAGGALGNFIDRFFSGRVVDFIDIYIGPYHWPAFNLADSAITIGILIILVSSLRKEA